ncbi:hypothetical protein DAEQUDRAFT_31418 [Daedalea quercina L-15889]|uniref:Protein prenylyltransferase n=1 Tax=Daedalea quercina L-15889 TaxID=1314783 RepID=A0A165SQ87_9APHY|nr:hypothetical protein DAEQUDRAFT_31418 [Daedalea quercina L-15889]
MDDSQSPAALLARLGSLLNTPPASVEILPGDGSDWPPDWLGNAGLEQDHRPFLYVDGHLGVPQKVLYRTYLVAVREFMRLRSGLQNIEAGSPEARRLKHLTAVILLANPAHQTALNTRKRLVSSGVLDATNELQLCTALLVVRECSKESLLWHHRRWLLCQAHELLNTGAKICRKGDSLRNIALSADSLRSEFSVATQACETYPRNYFAWAHRYLCLEALTLHACSSSPSSHSCRSVLLEELLFARKWVERHVSDYTAVHYLHNMHVLLLQGDNIPLPENASSALEIDRVDHRSLRASLYAHAKSLVAAYPEHESMWLYLRAAIDVCGSDPTFRLGETAICEDCKSARSSKAHSPLHCASATHAERHQAWLHHIRQTNVRISER